MDSRKTTTLIIVLIALIASRANAQVSVSLPDHGEYRVGQFMLVDIGVGESARDRTIRLSAPGALATTVNLRRVSRARVPMLMLSNDAGRVQWSIDGGPSGELETPLAPVASGAASAALNALGGPDAFAPTLAWNPGTSPRVRRVLILSTLLIALLILASVTLLKKRQAAASVFAVVAIASLALEFARRTISPIWRAEGQIIIVSATGEAQFDAWQYITTRGASDVSLEIPPGGTPVFVDAQHARDMQASLQLDVARNILSLRCRLQPAMKVAILQRRTTRAASPLPSTQPMAGLLKSPMGRLARRAYVDSATRIVDEGSVEWSDDQLVHWASVILYRPP